jgi:TonB family protein
MANCSWRRKGLLAIAAVSVLGAEPSVNGARAVAAGQQPSSSDAASLLVGTWVLLSTEDPSAPTPSRQIGNSVKTITNTGFVLTQTTPENGDVRFHHGGTYSFDGTTYTETIEFANELNRTLIGRTFRFRVGIEADGNTFRQVGLGNRWTETWKRLLATDPSSRPPVQALACEPSPEGRSALVELNRNKGHGIEARVETAVSALVEAIEKSTALATNYLDLARCYYTLRRRSDAAQALSRAIALIEREKVAQASKGISPGVVLKPVKTKDVLPEYPDDAATTRVTGVVVVEARVDAMGRVTAADVIRSIPMLDAAVLQAVRQWEYAPATARDAGERILFLTVTFGAASPTNGIDAGRFFAARGQYAESEDVLKPALTLINSEMQRAISAPLTGTPPASSPARQGPVR